MKTPSKFLFLTLLSAAALSAAAQTPQQDSWNRVLAQETVALRVLAQEQRATGAELQRLRNERVTAFRDVAERLGEYKAAFVADPNSVSAVNTMFRMGYYYEFGAWDEKALLFYGGCRDHPKVADSGAVFGQPPQPLQPQVQERIAAVLSRMGERGSPGTVHSLFVSTSFRGKGGIDFPGNSAAPEPLDAAEALTVAQRMSFPGELARARQDWRRLLEEEPRLLPVVDDVSVPGILVFGVKGKAEKTKQVATILDSFRRELTSRYFDSGLPGPTMVVFANLYEPEPAESDSDGAAAPPGESASRRSRRSQSPAQQGPQQQSPMQQSPVQQTAQRAAGVTGEEIGGVLSAKLHFRTMDGLEGYFESLDHTLVLRKNLLGADGQIFLGTGLHELVHGLMQVDYAQAPPWLNEGLAALHEEYGPSGPLDNYRLYVARSALRAGGRWPSLAQLLDARPKWWSGETRAVMAAASRYFCIFLWEQGQMPAVYKALRDAAPDESASAVLERVTGMSIQDLDARWQRDIQSRDSSALDSKWRSLRDPIDRFVGDLPELLVIQ